MAGVDPVRVFGSPEELLPVVGQRLGVSRWHQVDQALIDGFAELTGDRQWIHVDPERAAGGPYGGTIAHGLLLLGLISTMLDEVFAVGGVDLALNRGLDGLRFRNPVPAGSRVQAEAELVSAAPGMRGYFDVTVSATVRIEATGKPAYTVDRHTLYRRG